MKIAIPFHSMALLLAGAGLALVAACTKPTAFGAERLDEELAEFGYIDTLTLQCTILPEDSLVTSDRSSNSGVFFCGQINDPVFGRSQADLYSLFRMQDLGPNFKNAKVDSIVMFLRYASGAVYGDTLAEQMLEVRRIAAGSNLRWDRDFYSNESLPSGDLIGSATFFPQPTTLVNLFDTITKGAYIRIPLDNAFGQELLDTDSLTLTSDTLFWEKLRGLHISARSTANPGAMLAFDLNNATFSRVRLYYKYDPDTVATSRIFEFSFVGGNKFVGFQHDYAGSTVAPYLGGQPANDYLFVQGMSGLRVKVEIPYAHLLEDIAVNKAELELTAATLPNDNPNLKLADQLVFTEIIGDTVTTLTSDVLYSLGSTLTGGFNFFGGFAEKESPGGTAVDRYRMTLTRRFQKMVDNTSGSIKDQTLYVNVYPQSRSTKRAVFYGPKNTTFPAKLTVKYTRVR
ncbi:MAG: DUF4270 family protein [Saprospiraceae bacterium]